MSWSFVVATAVVCAGAIFAFNLSRPAAPALRSHGTLTHFTNVKLDAQITATLRRMTLEDKVGQLFVTYAYGSSAGTTTAREAAANRALFGLSTGAQLVSTYHLGGVAYFSWAGNLRNPTQIAGLSNGLQQAATHSGARIPLLIGVDQEQGSVTRIGAPAIQLPGNMALGADGDADDAYSSALITGQELAAAGINQNYAPVADVNVNPANPIIGVRSYGSNPKAVASLTAAQVRGYQAANVVATTKHFPGHGDTNVDSHTGIPVIGHTRAQWESIDRPSFQAGIDAAADSIMTAHIEVPSLDPTGTPATLSRPIITGILRGQMRYDGVVITDSLGMAGVREKYGTARVPVLALKAGVDQLLMPPRLPEAYAAVLAAVRHGELTEKRIDESVYRILRLKMARGLFARTQVDVSRVAGLVGTAGHRATAQQIAGRTITLVKNDRRLLPLSRTPGRSVLVTGWGTDAGLAGALTARGSSVRSYETGLSPGAGAVDRAVGMARAADISVVLTKKAWTSPAQTRLVAAMLRTGRPVIVVAVDTPYDLSGFANAPTYLATYSSSPASMASLAAALFGEVRTTAKLPVSIPGSGGGGPLFAAGFGLEMPAH
ncbi:MAG: glycoside hydrolase family 3 N-terminal domain-containing protein [Mycobacteriales bacterium]